MSLPALTRAERLWDEAFGPPSASNEQPVRVRRVIVISDSDDEDSPPAQSAQEPDQPPAVQPAAESAPPPPVAAAAADDVLPAERRLLENRPMFAAIREQAFGGASQQAPSQQAPGEEAGAQPVTVGALPRRELQRLAKQHGIKANMTSAAIVAALTKLSVDDKENALKPETPLKPERQLTRELCILCCDRQRAVRYRPCGHAVQCGLCTIKAIGKDWASGTALSCSICREEVAQIEWMGDASASTVLRTGGRDEPVKGELTGVRDFVLERADGGDAELTEAARRVLEQPGEGEAGEEEYGSEASELDEWALREACIVGDEEQVLALLEAGAEVELADGDGCTPLMIACDKGHEACARLLLDFGANANHANTEGPMYQHYRGITVLMIACWEGHLGCARLLLDRGASVDREDRGGDTALKYACLGGHLDLVRLLLDRGARRTCPARSAARNRACLELIEWENGQVGGRMAYVHYR